MHDGWALVTGGSRGIGAAVARQLATAGWPVAVAYRADEDGAKATCDAIEAEGGRATPFQADLADPAAANLLVDEVERRCGRVLALVNNAGARADALALGMSDAQWHQVLETNLGAAFRLSRRVLRTMLRSRYGRIVNVASVVGQRANAGQVNYAASKAGLIAVTRTVAVEVARRGITVNAVAPGFVRTELTSDVDPGVAGAIPIRRAGTADEVAACVRFLVSEEASYVTGAVLTVDGGLSA
jgi:3-oxoacyl-[acyl-carrier protein] reductase